MVGRPYIALPQNGEIQRSRSAGEGDQQLGVVAPIGAGHARAITMGRYAGPGTVVGRARHGHETSRAASSLGRAFSVRARAGPMGLA